MKKTSLAVVLPALALSALVLSGCSIFRSHKAWDTAKQESPLEIPPGMDRPSASDALVIPPPGANQPTANGATARTVASSGVITDGFVLADSVENTYQRVGKALASGAIGKVSAHDDAAHTYTASVAAADVTGKKPGFFSRLFGHGKSGEMTVHQVAISITPSGQGSSEIRAQGDAAAVAKTIDALKGSLGG